MYRWCIAYTMAHVIESELNDFVRHWNSHQLRANRLTGTPSAIPDDLYEMPRLYGIHAHM